MRILLLIADPARRERLLDACRNANHQAHAVDPLDTASAVFTVAPDRIDLLLLDPQLLVRHGAALLSDWRRMAPSSRVVMLTDAGDDLSVLKAALSHRA
ncbi:hypothetical protein J7U46_22870 [Pelomonas sp. V22]|uniref:hypothetical protein n=1 Tax=Pelomonas sp. V22 TaxID=2822139 RepID=UPI0024A8B18F|nr:hypothetical protein [Pelomonas sp. V22]MDI4635915.1 hypothetical protein [Pelomonas sp. V22]